MTGLTDYQAELARIEAEIAGLDAAPEAHDAGMERAKRRVYKRYQHASLRGDFAALGAVGETIEQLIRPERADPDLCYLKANVAFKFHRLDTVQRALEASPALDASMAGRALRADLDTQAGRYPEALAAYRAVIDEDRSWDNLARLAHLEFKLGDMDAAHRHFEEAEDELTVKEMRHYAWVQLQRGLLELSRGRHAEAAAHYERADRAYSGHWVVAEHRAELLAARGECEAAAALYERVVAEVTRPELMQALGELYAFMGRDDDAERWFSAARDAYMQSVGRGEIHYLHHLADFYADVRQDGEEAVRWAAEDLALRENHATLAAWAWALYRAGRFDEAIAPMERALGSGAEDAHLLERAASVMRAAGRHDEGDGLARRAHQMNPHATGFHVHR